MFSFSEGRLSHFFLIRGGGGSTFQGKMDCKALGNLHPE